MITKKGTVITKSGDKTVKVEVIDYVQHPKYKKRYPKTKRFLVHDESNKVEVGTSVTIGQSIKRSKKKSWEILTDTK